MKLFTLPDNWLELLAVEFPLESVSLKGDLCYLDISSLLARLDEVCGPNWSLSTGEGFPKVEVIYKDTRATGDIKYSVHALTSVTISIFDYLDPTDPESRFLVSSRSGTGADNIAVTDVPKAEQVDKIVKTAHAEATKKAAHQFGVGRYLWDDKRTEQIRKAITNKTPLPPPKTDISLIKRIQAVKAAIGISSNEQLDEYVGQFLSHKEITSTINIRDIALSPPILERFTEYLESLSKK